MDPLTGALLSTGVSLFSGLFGQNQQAQAARQQIKANRIAASNAFFAEQDRLNQTFEQAANQRQDLLQGLLKIQGTNAASGRYGRSMGRINAVEVLGNFGRQNAVITQNLINARRQTMANMRGIGDQAYGANLQAASQVPSTLGIVANSLMSGVGSYMSNKAPNAGSIGGGGGSFAPFSGSQTALSFQPGSFNSAFNWNFN